MSKLAQQREESLFLRMTNGCVERVQSRRQLIHPAVQHAGAIPDVRRAGEIDVSPPTACSD